MNVSAFKKFSTAVTVFLSIVVGFISFNMVDRNTSNFVISSIFVTAYLCVLIVFEVLLLMRFKIPGSPFGDGSSSFGIFAVKIALLAFAWIAITYFSDPSMLSNFIVLSVLNAFVASTFMDIVRRTRSEQ